METTKWGTSNDILRSRRTWGVVLLSYACQWNTVGTCCWVYAIQQISNGQYSRQVRTRIQNILGSHIKQHLLTAQLHQSNCTPHLSCFYPKTSLNYKIAMEHHSVFTFLIGWDGKIWCYKQSRNKLKQGCGWTCSAKFEAWYLCWSILVTTLFIIHISFFN